MGRSRTSKRVTWAPDVNLCQVRLFWTSKPPFSGGYEVDEELPPGFDKIHPQNLWRVNHSQSQIPLTKWRCPPRFEVNSEWEVVSGEESKEIQTQNLRQRGVLEAIYPRPSAIPPSPGAPLEDGETIGDDGNTPVIPLTPIEDADAATDNVPHSNHSTPSPQYSLNDIVAAALASNTDQIDLIDHDLLLRILTNPKLLQQLSIATVSLNPDSTLNATPMTTATAAPFHPPRDRAGFCAPSPPSHTVKDSNYYKTLIQQHGGGGQKRQLPSQSLPKLRDGSKPRVISKNCIYFKSPRGCRNGDKCEYQHDTTLSQQRVSCITEVPSAKRVKFSR